MGLVMPGQSVKVEHKDLEELTPEEVQEIAARGWHDPVFFCKYFLGELFPGRMPWLHRGILAILTKKTDFLLRYGEVDKIIENFVYERNGETYRIFERVGKKIELNTQRFTLLILPRGFSKTTIAGIGFGVYNIVYQELNFAAYVSETAQHAQMQLDNIKRQLEGNKKLKFFFGDLKPKMQDEQRWRQDFFETVTGMAMAARGRGGQVRGLNNNGNRPKMIVVDDVEDRESVSTPEQREKTRKWAYADLQPALPMLDPNATMVALGTLLHPDALMMTWARDPQWTVVKFGAYDRQGDLLWPENMDKDKLEKEEQSAVAAGTLQEFYMERHSEVRLEKDRDFKLENFVYEGPMAEEYLFKTLYQDPAISDKKRADSCTFTVVGMNSKGVIYMLEQRGKKGMKPSAQIDALFELHEKWNPDRTGIESNAFQAALVHLVLEEQFRRGRLFEVTPVTNTMKKTERIKGILQPRFAKRHIRFACKSPELEVQLLNFPMAAHDDHADGLAGAVSLLDDGAPMAEDEDKKSKVPPLEDVIGGEWRTAV